MAMKGLSIGQHMCPALAGRDDVIDLYQVLIVKGQSAVQASALLLG